MRAGPPREVISRNAGAIAGRSWGLMPLVLVVLALGVAALLARSQVHGWDSLAYAARAHDHPMLSERYLSTRLLHPHHLLYLPLARGFAVALRPVTTDPFLPLQILSALGLMVAAFVSGLIVRGRHGGWRRPVTAALAAGLAYGAWRYGGEVEVMTPALALMLLGVLALARARGPGGWVLAGIAFAGGTLLHEFVAVFALAVLAVTGAETARRRRPRSHLLGLALGFLVPLTGAYLAAAAMAGALAGPQTLAGWLTGAHGRAQGLGRLEGLPSVLSLGAIGGLVPVAPFSALRWQGWISPGAAPGVLLAFAVLVAAMMLTSRALPSVRTALRDGDPVARALVTGALALAAAIAYFQPWNEEYWVYLPPLLGLLVALHTPAPSPTSARVVVGLLAGLLALDLAYGWWPRRDPSAALEGPVVEFARARLTSRDLMVFGAGEAGLGNAPLAVPLLAGVDARVVPGHGEIAEEVRAAIRRRLLLPGAQVVATPAAWATVRHAAGPGWRLSPFGQIAGTAVARLERDGEPGPVNSRVPAGASGPDGAGNATP